MTDFGTMYARILTELRRGTDDQADVQACIQDAIKYYEDKPFWFNEAIETASTIASRKRRRVYTTCRIADQPRFRWLYLELYYGRRYGTKMV